MTTREATRIYQFITNNQASFHSWWNNIWWNIRSYNNIMTMVAVFKPFLTNWSRNKDEDEKVWENEFNFSIIHIKIKLYGNFHEDLLKTKFDPFLRHLWLIETKMKMEIKKHRKRSSIFDFSISKLGYMELFIKIWEKRFFQNFYLRRTYYNTSYKLWDQLLSHND